MHGFFVLTAAMFLAHYGWRSFAYPMLQRGGKATPVLIWLLATIFCMYNGFLQVYTPQYSYLEEDSSARAALL